MEAQRNATSAPPTPSRRRPGLNVTWSGHPLNRCHSELKLVPPQSQQTANAFGGQRPHGCACTAGPPQIQNVSCAAGAHLKALHFAKQSWHHGLDGGLQTRRWPSCACKRRPRLRFSRWKGHRALDQRPSGPNLREGHATEMPPCAPPEGGVQQPQPLPTGSRLDSVPALLPQYLAYLIHVRLDFRCGGRPMRLIFCDGPLTNIPQKMFWARQNLM